MPELKVGDRVKSNPEKTTNPLWDHRNRGIVVSAHPAEGSVDVQWHGPSGIAGNVTTRLLMEYLIAVPARNVDIQPTEEYDDARNTAATEWVKTQDPDDGADALALKQAFVVGADTSAQFAGGTKYLALIGALLAGRAWGQEEPK